MANFDELEREAYSLCKAGKNLDAALVFLRASDQALEFGNNKNWYKCRVWAAESFLCANQYAKSMDILLDISLHEPNDRPVYEAWIAHKKRFEISEETNPKLSNLQEILLELNEIGVQHNVQPADIPYTEGRLAYLRGEFTVALEFFQKAWHEYDEEKLGYIHYLHAKLAAKCCLKMNQREEAKDWLRATRRTCEDFKGCLYSVIELQIHYALATPEQASDLEKMRRELEDIAMMLQNYHGQDLYNNLGTRLLLLLHPKQDPLSNSHPAWKLFIKRVADIKSVHSQFNYRCLLLDVRLAALRFSCGIPPVDDYYYSMPQRLEKSEIRTTREEACRRLEQAIQSCCQAERYGRKIDMLLKCSWRQEEIQKRYKRISEIADYLKLNSEGNI